jgi:hypothetical protein
MEWCAICSTVQTSAVSLHLAFVRSVYTAFLNHIQKNSMKHKGITTLQRHPPKYTS